MKMLGFLYIVIALAFTTGHIIWRLLRVGGYIQVIIANRRTRRNSGKLFRSIKVPRRR